MGTATGAQAIVQPAAKNTAAGIALAAIRLAVGAIMLVRPTDDQIGNPAAFSGAAVAAAALAKQRWLVSFGIGAKSPETGYGYLSQGEAVDAVEFRVA